MLTAFVERIFSKRIRELERNNDDLRALLDKDFDKVSITQMHFDEKTGIEASFKTGIGGIFASWAYNALKLHNAENYVEFSVFHPEGGFLTITAQRRAGETPGAKAARLEKELTALKEGKSPCTT
jgi:hypothetical protein